MNEKILILYSNPADTLRLRLDKEHRAIDQVLVKRQLSADTVVRRHATTLADVTAALAELRLSVFQFSGHGEAAGVYFEGRHGEGSELASAEQLAHLLSTSQPQLRVALFMSCYSADAIPALIPAAPYLITVFGAAEDETTIDFSQHFYDLYLDGGSIEKACFFAQLLVAQELRVVLHRRAITAAGTRALLEVFPHGNHYGQSYLVDVSEAEEDIGRLDCPRETLLHLLSRKIRLHAAVFDSPREQAYLPVGKYVGVFSWTNSADFIKCHRFLQFKPGLEQDICDAWADLAVLYNDRAMHRYRLQHEPAAPYNVRALENALQGYLRDLNRISNADYYTHGMSAHFPDQWKLTKSVMAANLRMAEQKLAEEDLVATIVHLEGALSSLHDLLEALTTALTE